MQHLLPVVDRSRFSEGWGRCQRARFLQYSSVNGFGVRRKQQSLPLATGIVVHGILESLLKLGPADKAQQRKIILDKVEEYKKTALASGILQLAQETNNEESEKELKEVVAEQASLVEGLAWAAVKSLLPKIWREFEVVAVEHEEEYVLECDCGLGSGSGTGDDHEARECGGIVLMSKPDLILRDNTTKQLCYVEFKTSGDVGNYNWREQFEDNVQLALGVVGAEKRLGEEIPNCFVVGFNKGWRKKGYNTETGEYSGRKTQDSPFCYAYKKAANPPHWEEEWRTQWKYIDADGKNRILKGKGFDKAKVWEGEFAARPAGWTKLEYWTEFIGEEAEKEIVWLGPLPTSRYLVNDLLEGLGAEEKRWQERLWKIWEAKPEEFRSVLNKEVPQSRECHRWGKKCQFLSVCNRDEELVDEEGRLKEGWVFRRPHHQREITLMERLGVPIPTENGEGEEEE